MQIAWQPLLGTWPRLAINLLDMVPVSRSCQDRCSDGSDGPWRLRESSRDAKLKALRGLREARRRRIRVIDYASVWRQAPISALSYTHSIGYSPLFRKEFDGAYFLEKVASVASSGRTSGCVTP